MKKQIEAAFSENIYSGLEVIGVRKFGHRAQIKPSDLLPVDWQRKTGDVSLIADALRHGSRILALPVLTPVGRQYVALDGLHRLAAVAAADASCLALVAKTTDDKQRRHLFAVLNDHKQMESGHLVRANRDRAGQFVMQMEGSCLKNKINYGDSGKHGMVTAGVLVRCLLLVSGVSMNASIHRRLTALSAQLSVRSNMEHCIEYCSLLSDLIDLNPDAALGGPSRAIAEVSAKKLSENGRWVTPNVESLAKIDFRKLNGKRQGGGNNSPAAKLVRAVRNGWVEVSPRRRAA